MVNVIFNKTDYEIMEKQREIFDRYTKIIQWGRRHPDLFIEQFLGVELLDHQRYVILGTWVSRLSVWVMSRSSGKCTTLTTTVPTVNKQGNVVNKKIKDLVVGDRVLNENGKATSVISLNTIIIEDVYKVTFEDGEVIECNKEHLWDAYVLQPKNDLEMFSTWETGQLYNFLQGNSRVYIPLANSPDEKLPERYFKSDKKQYKEIISIEKTKEKKPMRCISVDNPTGLFLCGEHYTVTHNSFLSSPYVMARSILFPSHKTYIMAPAGQQSQETFLKLENLAKSNIGSALNENSVFLGELVKSNSASDGFTHDKTSYSCQLFNGSEINSLNSVAKNIVGKLYCRFRTKSNVLFI